jgi:hypothetical protein
LRAHAVKLLDVPTEGLNLNGTQALQAHTSQLGWEPPNAPSLWARPTPCGLAPWTTQTIYVVGSRVTFNGQTYQCRQAHTSQVGWDPVSAPSLWLLAPPG